MTDFPSYPGTSGLLPCPFCGNAPVIANIKPHSHKGGIAEFMPDHPGSSYVECSCGAGLIDATEELVVARWNKRCGVPAQGSQEAREKEITRLATIETCAQIVDQFGEFAGPESVKMIRSMCATAIAEKIRALSVSSTEGE